MTWWFCLLLSFVKGDNKTTKHTITYKFKDNWTAVFGIDVFDGEPDGEFGQFDDKDRAYVELKYDF